MLTTLHGQQSKQCGSGTATAGRLLRQGKVGGATVGRPVLTLRLTGGAADHRKIGLPTYYYDWLHEALHWMQRHPGRDGARYKSNKTRRSTTDRSTVGRTYLI